LAGLRLYPLKSARALTPAAWPLDHLGLAYDRRWLVALPDGTALTQREEPRLALLQPALADCLTLTAPGLAPLELPLDPPPEPDPLRVRVLGADLDAAATSGVADAWVSRFLGYPARVARQLQERVVDPAYARSATDRTAFTDGFPLLLVTHASLDDLNARLPEAIPVDRFRPNLLIDGAAPFAEDGWARIRVGQVELAVVKPCARCVITTTDQRTGARGDEPLRTLSTYRRAPNGKVYFAQNAIHLGTGTLHEGDVISVLETREPILPGAQMPPALP
jgi:hypothetical protein